MPQASNDTDIAAQPGTFCDHTHEYPSCTKGMTLLKDETVGGNR